MATQLQMMATFDDSISKDLSPYGDSSPEEFFAEAVGVYMTSGPGISVIADTVMRHIVDDYTKKFGHAPGISVPPDSEINYHNAGWYAQKNIKGWDVAPEADLQGLPESRWEGAPDTPRPGCLSQTRCGIRSAAMTSRGLSSHASTLSGTSTGVSTTPTRRHGPEPCSVKAKSRPGSARSRVRFRCCMT